MGLDAIGLVLRLEERFGVKISPEEMVAVLSDTAGTIHRCLVGKLHGESRKAPRLQPLFAEVSKAVNRAAGWWRLTSPTDLNKRLSPAKRKKRWESLEQALGVSLPKLEQPANEEFPRIPRECDSIVSLAYWIAEHHPGRVEWFPVNCERTGIMATQQWSDDEIWAILRECICEELGVKREEVTYHARMVEDLGMN